MAKGFDPETGEVLADPCGSPFLMSYSFSYEAAAVPNLPYNVTNEKLILPEAWVPLRPLESYEKLAFRSQLPPEAGLLVVFSSNDAPPARWPLSTATGNSSRGFDGCAPASGEKDRPDSRFGPPIRPAATTSGLGEPAHRLGMLVKA
jgi:hypothetical protein